MTALARSTLGVVTSPHTLANEAGLSILSQGGNAIEAAIATAAVLAVTYPHFCGLGGDAVWLVADREGRATTLLGIGQAARSLPPFKQSIPTRGGASALTSACAVASWEAAQDYSRRNWNGRLTLASLLEAAIGHAENGFPLTASQSFWQTFRAAESFAWPGFTAAFGMQEPGASFAQPNLAASLKAIARNGAREFYEGELGARLGAGLALAGSPLTQHDLAATAARICPPLRLDYRDVTLLAPPSPTQGLSTLAIMGILREFDVGALDDDGADFYHLCVEAVKQAFLSRDQIADPDVTLQTPNDWLATTSLKAKAANINRAHAMEWRKPFKSGDTVYIGVSDKDGHSVSLLQSIYYDWGSGVVVGDTGVIWQNRGAAFALDPGNPNVLAPGKRPFYTLNPGIALSAGNPSLLYGTQGADGQPQTLSIVLARLIDYKLDPLEALRRPRFLLGRTFSDSHDTLKLEDNIDACTIAQLRKRGHEVALIPALSQLAGHAGVIYISKDGTMLAAHDPRSDGRALGL